MQKIRILAINPGSTSTKVALYKGAESLVSTTVEHTSREISSLKTILDQKSLREQAIKFFLEENRITNVDAVVGRGGLLRPVPGGTYKVNDRMCRDLAESRYGEHASNLGPLLARHFGEKFNAPAFIVDPVTTDEFVASSRISGVPGIERKCRIHALNIRAVARRCATEIGKSMENTTFVIAHMGGGITVCALVNGRIIDSTDALLGEGPFSMERAGTLPLAGIVDLCFEKGLTKDQVVSLLSKQSGFKGYIGTDRLTEVLDRINAGDEKASLIFEAMVMQTVKWIGGMIALVKGKLDAVLLTGGMANSQHLTNTICKHISPLAEVELYPGEFEMEALAEGALRVLQKNEAPLEY